MHRFPKYPASIRGVLLMLILAVVLPLSLMQAGIYAAWYRSRWSEQQAATLETAREVAKTFEAYVQDVQRQESAIIAALAGPHSYTAEEARVFLSASGRGYPCVRSWSWIDGEGRVVASSQPNEMQLNYGNQPFFHQLRSGPSPAVGNLAADPASGSGAFVIASRIDGANGSPAGAIVAAVEVADLGSRAIALHHVVGEDLALFDGNGLLAFHSKPQSALLHDWSGRDPLLAETLQSGDPRPGVVGLPSGGKTRENYIAARVPVGKTGWVAGAHRPVSRAMAEVHAGLWIAAGLNLVVAVGSGGLALAVGGSLIRQLRRLQSHAQAIGQGDFDHSAGRNGLRELDELASAFNGMGQAVRRAQRDLEETNAVLDLRVRERTSELAESIRRLEQTDRELRAASNYARGLIEASLDPLVTISPEGKITDVNEATEAATGIMRSQLIGTDFSNYFTQPDLANDGYRRVLSEGLVRDYPLTIRHVSGRTIDVLYNATVYRSEGGDVRGVFAAARDVTERRRIEKELNRYRAHLEELVQQRTDQLEAANAQLQAVFDVVNVGMFLIGEDGAVKRFNNTVSRWVGRDLSSQVGDQPGDLIGCIHALGESAGCGHAPACRSCAVRNALETVVRTGQPVHDIEAETILSAGENQTHLWLKMSADPLVLDGKRHVILAMNDITALKRTEEALRESQKDLNRAQAVAQIGSWRLDVRRDELLWSDENHRMFGIAKGIPLTYETFLAAIHPDDRDRVDQMWKAALGGEPYDVEHRIVVDGSERWVHERAELEFDQTKSIAGGFGTTQDITDRKQTEEALRRTTAELARSNEELEQFAYVASHDLQEPLRVVAGYVQLVDRKYKGRLDVEADEFFAYIVDGVTRMQQLIADLLEYSRVGMRGRPFAPVGIAAVLDRVRANLKEVVEESGAAIECEEPLPTVQGDEMQLVRLFQNLIGNGIKFRGGRAPEIRISARRDGDGWEYAVRDNGIGIDPQYWDRIFVIFQRLHTRQKYAGTGIGLTICKRIVERHGGKIWLESEPGQGTTFHFTLLEQRRIDR